MNFDRIARVTARASGSSWAFGLAVGVVALWAALGPHYEWSEEHSLFINTATTIVTFVMVFLIQASQNRDTLALQAKIDALLKVSEASNRLLRLEERSEDEIRQERDEIARDASPLP